jgi:hypothetical protein
LCEVKNNLPASWAKEQLKAVGRKGFVQKALSQSNQLLDFLKTPEGMDLFYTKAISSFPKLDLKRLFPTGFCGVVNSLIITSQNIGMFFPKTSTTIVDYWAFKHIVELSDGDVNYIKHHTRKWGEAMDLCYRTGYQTAFAGDLTISYECAEFTNLIRLEKNSFLSDGSFDEIEIQSLATGYRFIDTLESAPEEDIAGKLARSTGPTSI